MENKRKQFSEEAFYRLEVKALWQYFKSESFAFWMITLYLFTEYVRPQSILPWLDFLPWAQIFIIGALGGLFLEPKTKWAYSPINKWLFIFFVVIIISCFNAYNPSIAFSYLEFFYIWLIVYLLIVKIVNTEKRLIIFISVFLLASFKLSLSLTYTWASRGFSFTSWGLKGPEGFFQNSGELAIQMAIYWPLAFAFVLFFRERVSKIKKWILILMPVTAGMVILGSSSRGGQLALFFQVILRFGHKIFKPKMLLVFAIIIFVGWKYLPVEQKLRFETMGEDETSQQRILYWENGIEIINQHPLLGIGHFNFPSYYEAHYASDMLFKKAELAHNVFIQVGADLGYTGLLVYLLIIFSAFGCIMKVRKLSDNKKSLLNLVAGSAAYSIIGFLIGGQFVSVAYYPFLWIHLAIVSCVYNIARANSASYYGK